MPLSTPHYIGLRYTWSKRGSGFLSFISLFATGGMALGVFALVLVLSVMNGFDHELKQRLLRAIPHAFVTQAGGLEDWEALREQILASEEIEAASPYVGGNALVSHNGAMKGIMVQGVSPEHERSVSSLSQFMTRGALEDLAPGEFGIVLGSLLAYSMGVQTGDEVVITLPKVSITFAGVFPRTRQFKVVGLFEVGAEVDQTLGVIHLQDAQRLFQMGDTVAGLRLRYPSLYDAPRDAARLQASLGEAMDVTDWSETQGSLFQAVKLEKTVTGLLLGIIIAVAAFNIVTSLIMMVTEKRSDIAVLRTMGMTRGQVMRIFVTQGMATALLGISLGLATGIPAALYLPDIMAAAETHLGLQIFDPSVYFVTRLPSLWMWTDTAVVALGAVLSALLATLYPAYRASTVEPAEAIRYNV